VNAPIGLKPTHMPRATRATVAATLRARAEVVTRSTFKSQHDYDSAIRELSRLLYGAVELICHVDERPSVHVLPSEPKAQAPAPSERRTDLHVGSVADVVKTLRYLAEGETPTSKAVWVKVEREALEALADSLEQIEASR
jgi:hypothetical protein